MKIGVVGAGAIGGAVAARLANAGNSVALVVRSASRRVLLTAQGLTCTEASETIWSRPDAVERLGDQPLDMIVLAVKAADLVSAVEEIPVSAIDSGTIIVPLVNGVPWWLHQDGTGAPKPIRSIDPDGTLFSRFSPEAIAGSVVYTTAAVEGPTRVRVTRTQSLIMGAVVPGGAAACEAAVTVFQDAGISVQASKNIRDQAWTKIALNLATNPLSVVAQASLGTLCSDPRLEPLVQAVLDETWLTASRFDARPAMSRSQMLERGKAAGSFRTSMLEDYANGKALELGAIADAVFELAEAAAVSMPLARSITDLARYKASARPEER